MDIKKANQILCEFMEDDSCMCLVNRICPSPSSHHEFCINNECNKKITHTSHNPYARDINSLTKVWNELFRGYSQIQITSTLSEDGLIVSFLGADGETILSEEGRDYAGTYCLATAKFIKKMQEDI
jgi:hypothetical protein